MVVLELNYIAGPGRNGRWTFREDFLEDLCGPDRLNRTWEASGELGHLYWITFAEDRRGLAVFIKMRWA